MSYLGTLLPEVPKQLIGDVGLAGAKGPPGKKGPAGGGTLVVGHP